MPPRKTNSRFFLARVTKLGLLDNDRFIQALLEPVTVRHGDYLFTITDGRRRTIENTEFIIGRLVKFLPEGEVSIVDPEAHHASTRPVENFIVAESLFTYAPEYSGIAYQHIWNLLESQHFETVLPILVRAKYGDFFVDLVVEPITDLRTFIQRLARLQTVLKIDATVHPPNPLFSPIWRSLKEYVIQRKAEELEIRENSKNGLSSALPQLARQTPERGTLTTRTVKEVVGRSRLDVGDAAVLMAADGYGKASVVGTEPEKQKRTVIRTKENQVSFELAKESPEDAVCEEAERRLSAISRDRGLKH